MSSRTLGERVRSSFESQSFRSGSSGSERTRERGQVLPIFVIMAVVILGGAALITDAAYWWMIEQRMVRAADAGSLAGAVYLPGDETRAFVAARAEASKNGYTNGVDGVTITPRRDPLNERKLIVDIDGGVKTNFARVFGYEEFPVSVTSAAEFVLPVPMGSPENYYGVFGKLNTASGYTTVGNDDSGFIEPIAAVAGSWTNPENAFTSESPPLYATKNSTTNPNQAYGFPDITFPAGSDWSVTGIEVETIARSTDSGGCRLGVEISGDGGGSWTNTGNYDGLDNVDTLNLEGGSGSTWGRGSSYWTESRLSSANFRVRVRYIDPGFSCANGSTTRLDRVRVNVTFTQRVPDANVAGPNGEVLTPRGFWASMMTQGAETTNGDAFLPYYNRRVGILNDSHNTSEYYNYAVEMPPGSTYGRVYIFDPGFCAGDLALGLGDSWAGNRTTDRVSTFYTMYEDTYNTPYYFDDDTDIVDSGDLFRRISGRDGDLTNANDTPGPQGCDEHHLKWYELTEDLTSGLSGGTDGRVYRLHATTYDPTDVSGQRGSNARNHFSIFVDADLNGGTVSPRIYGIGAMGMFTQLPGGQSSEFYLAQIGEEHKGKTVQIKLWDAGDTNQTASIQILGPTSGGWAAESMTYTAVPDSYAAGGSWCDDTARTGTSIITNQSGTRRYNGCWLTITIPLPGDYEGHQDGWWKIKYDISGTSTATDITTWQVALIGNPVHLVQE